MFGRSKKAWCNAQAPQLRQEFDDLIIHINTCSEEDKRAVYFKYASYIQYAVQFENLLHASVEIKTKTYKRCYAGAKKKWNIDILNAAAEALYGMWIESHMIESEDAKHVFHTASELGSEAIQMFGMDVSKIEENKMNKLDRIISGSLADGI